MRQRLRGFSMTELVVVMAIAAILISVAVPSYREYVRKSNRTVAKALINEVQSRQESFFADRKRYANSLTELAYPADVIFIGNDGTAAGADFDQAIYSITLDRLEPAGRPLRYTILALPVHAQETDRCGELSMRHTGRKTATGGPDCWRS